LEYPSWEQYRREIHSILHACLSRTLFLRVVAKLFPAADMAAGFAGLFGIEIPTRQIETKRREFLPVCR
jgi:hypothetical protein